MTSLKKYYLVPENRYKMMMEKKDLPEVNLPSPKKLQKIEEKSSSELISLPAPSYQQTGGADIVPSKIEEKSLPGEGNLAISLPEVPIKRPLPPPGIPVRKKRQRILPWISLK